MVDSLDRTLAALADPTRRSVIDLLGREPLASGELASSLATSRPVMSRHLRVLRQAGLVEEESPMRDARVRVYQLRRDRLAELRAWLDDVESFWRDQLDAFKDYAEGREEAGDR